MNIKLRKVNPGEETRTLIRVDEALKTIALFGAVIVGSYVVVSGIYNIGYSNGVAAERTVSITDALKWRDDLERYQRSYYDSGFAAGKAWKEAGKDKVSVGTTSSNSVILPTFSSTGTCVYNNGVYNCTTGTQ